MAFQIEFVAFPNPEGWWIGGKAYKYFKANSSAELLRCLLTSKEFWVLKALQNGWRHETIVTKLSKLPNMNPNSCELEFSPLNLRGVLLWASHGRNCWKRQVLSWPGCPRAGRVAFPPFPCVRDCVQSIPSRLLLLFPVLAGSGGPTFHRKICSLAQLFALRPVGFR